jgi:hypothetical protein
LEFRNGLKELYSSLFGTSDNGGGENYFGEKWGWYISIDAVAGGDRFKHEQVYGLTIYQFLTHLEFLKDKNQEEVRQIKANEKRS